MTWTPGRLKAFITSTLRGGFRRYPPKYEKLNKAKTVKKVNKETGRIAMHYKCAKCKKQFPLKQVQVDHIVPIVNPKIGFTTWDDFISRLFCDESNLQVLCKSCHAIKTKKERQK
jgi:5-methylcytosine-specific restriction endonuclease McrA